MFLRATKRFKDGKFHSYWSLVESVRVGRRVFQRRALYLGELSVRDELIARLAVAETKAGRAWKMIDVAILLDRLGLTLPAQPPPKISGSLADTAKTKV